MRYYIGIDSGGTKTDAVLFDGIGRVRCRIVGEGCNPNQVGMRASLEKLTHIINRLSENSPERVASVFAGVAGISDIAGRFASELSSLTGISQICAGGDAIPQLTSAFNRSDGCVVISGTGISCFYRIDGKIGRVGGWGYLLDAAGSGYSLGRDAIAAVLRAYDGRGEETVLTDILTARMGCHPKDNINKIYSNGLTYISSFADAVFEGCRFGDRISREIMTRNVEAVAELIKIASNNFGTIFTVALGGGVFIHNPAYSAALREIISGRINLKVNTAPAVYGSAVEAVYCVKNEVPFGFKDNFLGTYKTVPINRL